MVKNRSVGFAVLLTLITCGIYGIFWFIFLTDDVGKLSGDNSFTGGKAFLFTLLTCGLYHYYWCYQIGKLTAQAQENQGYPVKDNSTLYMILSLFGLSFVVYIMAQADVNSMA